MDDKKKDKLIKTHNLHEKETQYEVCQLQLVHSNLNTKHNM